MTEENKTLSSIHQRFLSHLDEYRDYTTWGNFTENFTDKLSFASKILPIEKQPQVQVEKIYELETQYLHSLVNKLTETEVIEWEEAAEQFARRQVLAPMHSDDCGIKRSLSF